MQRITVRTSMHICWLGATPRDTHFIRSFVKPTCLTRRHDWPRNDDSHTLAGSPQSIADILFEKYPHKVRFSEIHGLSYNGPCNITRPRRKDAVIRAARRNRLIEELLTGRYTHERGKSWSCQPCHRRARNPREQQSMPPMRQK